MATFMTRVELHGATYQDYVALHGHMTQCGFQRIPATYSNLMAATVPT